MSDRLLREYLSLIIEKIRTQKKSSGRMGDHFDLKRFKDLDGSGAMLTYAGNFLEKLGQGTSRAAFLLSGKYALKIALNEKGRAQNEAELDVYTNPKTKAIVAKVYSSHDGDLWIISDLVKPVQSTQEFEQLAGIDWRTFSLQVDGALRKVAPTSPEGPSKLVGAAVETAKANNMLPGDMVGNSSDPKHGLDHWGKTPDGRLVLLDYGLTRDVWDKHYESEPKVDYEEPSGTKRREPEAPHFREEERTKRTKPAAAKRPELSRTLKAAGQD